VPFIDESFRTVTALDGLSTPTLSNHKQNDYSLIRDEKFESVKKDFCLSLTPRCTRSGRSSWPSAYHPAPTLWARCSSRPANGEGPLHSDPLQGRNAEFQLNYIVARSEPGRIELAERLAPLRAGGVGDNGREL